MKNLWLLVFCFSLGLTSCLDKLADSPDGEGDSEEEVAGTDEKRSASEAREGKKKSSKQDKRSFTEIRSERKALEKRVAELKALAESANALVAEEVEVTDRVNKIRAYHGSLTTLHGELTKAKEAWKAASRESFVGVELPEITTSDGNKYQSVKILKIEENSISIAHSGGTENIEVVKLPVGLRKNILHEATVLATRGAN